MKDNTAPATRLSPDRGNSGVCQQDYNTFRVTDGALIWTVKYLSGLYSCRCRSAAPGHCSHVIAVRQWKRSDLATTPKPRRPAKLRGLAVKRTPLADAMGEHCSALHELNEMRRKRLADLDETYGRDAHRDTLIKAGIAAE